MREEELRGCGKKTQGTHEARRKDRDAGRRAEKGSEGKTRVKRWRGSRTEEEAAERVRAGQRRKSPDLGRVQYLLETAAPDTVLPAPVRTLGVQTGGAVGQEVTGSGAGQWGR